MNLNKRRKRFMGSTLQKKLLILVFSAAIIPSTIVAVCLYYLIFNMLAWQLGIPEAVAYNLIPVARKVNLIIIVVLPVTVFILWSIALELSHRIVGPIFRLEKELDERIAGTKKGAIRFRRKDEFKAIADKINKLIVK